MKKLVLLFCMTFQYCYPQMTLENIAADKLKRARATKDLANNNIEWANLAYDAVDMYIKAGMKDSAYSAFEVLTLTKKEREWIKEPLPTFMKQDTKEKLRRTCFKACFLFSGGAEFTIDANLPFEQNLLLYKIYDTMASECHFLGFFRYASDTQRRANFYLLLIDEKDFGPNYIDEIKRAQFFINLYDDSKKKEDVIRENKTQNLVIEQQTKIKNLFIAGFAILAIVMCVLVYFINQRNKANKKLSNALIELKGTQEQLVHQEKMASLGQLTTGVAHEIQNPLNFVNNFSALSLDLVTEAKQEEDNSERELILDNVYENLSKINFHGKRAESVVKNMMMYSRTGHVDKQSVNINSFIEEILNLSYQSFQSKYSGFECGIIKEFENPSASIKIIPQDFSRMFLNLFNNAFYALNERLKNAEVGYLPQLKVVIVRMSGNTIIKIHDNGIGIPDEIKEKIYNPFYTTKPTGEGTGLGLGISYDIVKSHAGKLSFKSAVNSYTEFEIEFTA